MEAHRLPSWSPCNRKKRTGKATISTDTAELKGVRLVLDDMQRLQEAMCTVFTDESSRNPGNGKPKCPFRQYNLVEAAQTLQNLRLQGWEVQFRWVLSHTGVPGNEAAKHQGSLWLHPDCTTEPRAVTRTRINSSPSSNHEIYYSSNDERRMGAVLGKAKHGRELFRLSVRLGKGNVTLYTGIHRAISPTITQIYTGKIGLRAYLDTIKKPDADQC